MNERLQPWLERWRALAPRERRLLLSGGVAVLLTLVFLGVIEPLAKAHQRRESALAQSRALAQRLEQIAAEVQMARGSVPVASMRSLSLLAAVDQSVKQSALGKPPSRIQPDGDKQVKVWFEAVAFDALVPWLYDLETRYGVFAQGADIERESTAGQVNAQLTLVRP